MTDSEADVAERVLLDYQQSFKALQDLSQKIRLELPVPKGVAFCLKVNVDMTQLCQCLETEQISLSDKIQAITTNLELTRISSN